MLPIKVGLRRFCDKELAPSGVGACISHRHRTFCVFQLWAEFIFYHISRTASPIPVRVTALYHKTAYYPVERKPVIESFLRQINEVLCSNGCILFIEFKLDSPFIRYNSCDPVFSSYL